MVGVLVPLATSFNFTTLSVFLFRVLKEIKWQRYILIMELHPVWIMYSYLFDGIYLLLGEDGTVVDSLGFPILQYVYGQFWVNNHAHIITGKEGFSVEELYLLFSLTNIKSIVTGAVQQKVSQQNLKKVPAIIPGKEALDAFDEIIQPVFTQIRNLRDENANLAVLRDTLLPKLMSGELDVSDVDL